MNITLQFISSFIAAAGFGVVVNVPRRVLVSCGITGVAGWLVYSTLMWQNSSAVTAIFFGAVSVAIASLFFARRKKMPATTFNLPGLFPLVPGITAYQSIQALMQGDYTRGIELLVRVFMLSVTIAFGIVLVEIIYRTYFVLKARWLRKRYPNTKTQ